MGALAFGAVELCRSGPALGRDGGRLALRGEAEEVALHHMRHDEAGRGGNRLVNRTDGIADEALQFMHRALIVGERVRCCAGQFEIECIAHVPCSCLPAAS
jgi:hypothetical protein